MMQCGSSLRGQDSGLTDDGEYLIIYSSSTSYGHSAVLCCQVCHPAAFTISHNYQKISIVGKLQTHQYICNETLLGCVLLQIKGCSFFVLYILYFQSR